ncbi:MAG: type IV secretion system DNA-binding domain-containing protein [Nitratireductor sp.]
MSVRNQVLSLGTTLGRRRGKVFGIRQADRRFHLFALGQTGTGKTTLIASLVRQDIAQGRGFCLVDPHGDLAEQIAAMAGGAGVYWNVADPTSPYGYNPLSNVSAKWRPLVASGLVDTLKKQWPDAWGARMEHLLRFAVLALLEQEGATLADILPLFLDKEYRKDVVAGISDEQVRRFWTVEYGKLRYQFSPDGVTSIANKLGAFLAHPVVRKAVCAPETPLRFRQIMDEGGMLIVNLAKGRLGADIANVVGGLVVSAIASAAYSRQNQPEAARRPFALFVDEFHSFSTSAFGDMLSELRKYGVSLVITTQHFSRIEPDVREAILGNVGTLISFRVGATDAALLARQFGEDLPRPRDLVNLANH